jgi:glycosyltransferase involved in cell wall biosynthesis
MKILITSKQRPYYGGAATNAYELTKFLRNNKINTCCLYFNNDDVDVDPDNIEGVFKVNHNSKKKEIISEDIKNNQIDIIVQYLNGYPDIVLAFNYYVPIISKNTFPMSKVIYMAIGSPILTLGNNCPIKNNISVQKFLSNDIDIDKNNKFYKLEKESIQISDYILADHGSLLVTVLKKIYNITNNISWIDYSSLIIKNKVNNSITKNTVYDKKYDLIIVASNWDRLVKNKTFCKKVFEKFPNLNKLVIGNNSNYFKSISNTTIYELLPYDKLLIFLSQSKLLLIPSFFESGPNILIEALELNCKVLSSYNIGKYHLLLPQYLCKDVYDIIEWENKIISILNNNSNQFIKFLNHRLI